VKPARQWSPGAYGFRTKRRSGGRHENTTSSDPKRAVNASASAGCSARGFAQEWRRRRQHENTRYPEEVAALVRSGFCSAYEPHHKTRLVNAPNHQLDRPAHVRLAARPNTGALQAIIETLNRPALATPRRGHSLAKIARSSQSDSVGCHLQNMLCSGKSER
jgi:hypothetical protein